MKPIQVISKVIPGVNWLKGYSTQDAVADLIAGITVGLTVLPQSLAYSTLAGLPPQYGLYSAFVGGIVYALLGGCRQVTIGPTALLGLITSRHTSLGLNSGPEFAILLCFLSGIVEMLMALLQLGALVDLISLPVTVGFTSAMAVIIGTSQIKGLLGLKGGSGAGFIETISSVYNNLDKVRLGDMILGFTSITILLLLRKLKDVKIRNNKTLSGFFWTVSTARNALIVLVASVIAFYTCDGDSCPFKLTGEVKSGIPDFRLPPFETDISGPLNGTSPTSIHLNFKGMIEDLGPTIIILPVLAVLGNVAISKAFGGAGLSATRELVALSLSNICGSFFSSIPVTGSFSRSAVNHATGVRTPIGGIYTSVLVLLALGVLTPYFQYIPKAALSAVIISAVIFMIEYEVIKPLWRCSRRELLPGAITFILSLLFGIELGLLLGVATDIAFLVYRAARPALCVNKQRTTNGIEYIYVRPNHSAIYFPAIEWVRSGISKAISEHGVAPVLLDCSFLTDFDFTAARGMSLLYKELTTSKIPLFILSTNESIRQILHEASNNSIPVIGLIENLESQLESSPEYEMYFPLVVNHNGHHDKAN